MQKFSRSIVFFLALVAVALAAPARVINLKSFMEWEEWQLDITYQAKDTFENQDHVAELEMTATARYFLKRIHRSDAWGQWQAQECQTNNLAYRAVWQNKHRPSDRTEYVSKGSGPMIAPLADFQVGGATPGYMLVVNGGFPAQMKSGPSGVMDYPLLLGTTVKDQPGLSGVITGPLPASGTLIQGSKVIPAEIAPFLTDVAGMTKMSIQYVLRPVPLSPLHR